MLAQQTRAFRDMLAREGIIFCYSGYITEGVLTGIGAAIKNKLSVETADKKTARGVFSLFIEQVQNIIRYSAETQSAPAVVNGDPLTELRYGIVTVGKLEGRYFVACANMINRTDVERLRTTLAELQTLDQEALKTLYKERLRGETPEGSKGAGAGFIDIARRATDGFEFDFIDIDDVHAYFAIKAFI